MNGAMSHNAAPMADAVVKAQLDAAVARQGRETGERITRRRDLRADVRRLRETPVAGLEVAHAALRRRRQQRPRPRHRRRRQLGRDHRHLDPCAVIASTARGKSSAAFSGSTPLGANRQIDAVEAGLLHRLAELAPPELRQVLREQAERPLARRTGPRGARVIRQGWRRWPCPSPSESRVARSSILNQQSDNQSPFLFNLQFFPASFPAYGAAPALSAARCA